MAKKKYYAIKEDKGVKNKIIENWTECKELVQGYPSVYKSFSTKEEAENFLQTVNVKKAKQQVKNGIEYNKARKKVLKC